MMKAMDDFTRGYIDCALWLADEEPGPGEWSQHPPYSVANIDVDSLGQIVNECTDFQRSQTKNLLDAVVHHDYDSAMAGHDFFLTRNGHGAGYWDRGLGDIGEELTKAAHGYGEQELYRGDGGKLYV